MQLVEELQAIVSGFVGGAKYGVKIRFPHALVMTVLFRQDLSPLKKLQAVIKLTYAHTRNLAIYVAGYKFGIAVLKWLARKHREHALSVEDTKNISFALGQKLLSFLLHGTFRVDPSVPRELAPPGYPERYHHALLAGLVTASCTWGKFDGLNYQVLLYVASRVLIGTWKRLFDGPDVKGKSHPKSAPTSIYYRLFTGLMWGTAMMLWEETPHVLHPSMKKSMDEIYHYSMFSPTGMLDRRRPLQESCKLMPAQSPRLYTKKSVSDPLADRG